MFLHWKSTCVILAVGHVSGGEDLCRIGCVNLLILQETMGDRTPEGILSCLHYPREKNHHVNQKPLPKNVMVDCCLRHKCDGWLEDGWSGVKVWWTHRSSYSNLYSHELSEFAFFSAQKIEMATFTKLSPKRNPSEKNYVGRFFGN